MQFSPRAAHRGAPLQNIDLNIDLDLNLSLYLYHEDFENFENLQNLRLFAHGCAILSPAPPTRRALTITVTIA